MNGLTLERRNPAGHWWIKEREDLGSWTQLEFAVQAAEAIPAETSDDKS